MKTTSPRDLRKMLSAVKYLLFVAAILTAVSISVSAQTAGGTQIQNRARIAYTEPGGGAVTGSTNTYTVTVSNVAGLAITPDGGSLPQTTVGTTGILVPFAVCNTGNFTNTVRFPAGSSEIILSGASATLTRAVVDVNGNNLIDAGDTDIMGGSAADISLTASQCRQVLVELTATTQGTIRIKLGDAAGDNRVSDASVGSIATTLSAVNGFIEATGDYGVSGGTGIPVVNAPAVLNGPNGDPAAVGPVSNNDDFQEKTALTGIAAIGEATTAANTVVFTNTVRNDGGVADPIVISATTLPVGLTVEGSANCSTYSSLMAGGTITLPAVAPGGTHNYCVRVTAPVGTASINSFNTVLRATSSINATVWNETIDRLWTGYVRAVKSATITNSMGFGGPNDPVPGAVITYSIVYTNMSSTLAATNVVITEDGNAAPNNWGTTTNHVAGSATDTRSGAITGDTAGSNVLTDTITSLPAGQSGTFSFRRTIK